MVHLIIVFVHVEFYLRSFVRVKSISLSKGNPNGLSSKPEYPFVTS